MPRERLGASAGLAWWALARFLTRPSSLRSGEELFQALGDFGLGTFRALQGRLHGEDWSRRESEPSGKWVERLQEALAPMAFQGADPQACWNRTWDKKWRLLAFDIPARPQAPRLKLWRWLKRNRLGLVQRSLWISAKPLQEIRTLFHGAANSHSVFLWEAPTPTGLNPISIVEQAWDMAEINSDYQAALHLTQEDPTPEHIRAATLQWQKAVRADPLLPRNLYPKSFRGFRATEQLQKMWSKFRGAGA